MYPNILHPEPWALQLGLTVVPNILHPERCTLQLGLTVVKGVASMASKLQRFGKKIQKAVQGDMSQVRPPLCPTSCLTPHPPLAPLPSS